MNLRAALLAAAVAAAACGPRARLDIDPPVPPPVSNPVQQLQRDIDLILDDPALSRGSWGVLVRSLAGDQILYSRNPRKLLMPASNMKIVTLAVAAERLGWDYTFETRLIAHGTVHDGVLDGDLVVVGTGDPSFDDWDGAATRVFHAWSDQLKAAGIRAVSGRVIGDDRAFADDPYGIGWAWDDLDNSYGTAVGALQFNENTARLLVEPATTPGGAATVRLQQPGSGLTPRASVTTMAGETSASISTRRLAGSPYLDIHGSVPLAGSSARPILVNVSVLNPTLYFVTALRDALVASGIDVRGSPADIEELGTLPDVDGPLIATYRSPPLSELATTMMKLSQNLYAETLLRMAGGTPASLDAGRSATESILRAWGIEPADLVIADGSGLSRNDLITPEASVTVLTHVERDSRLQPPFEHALPVAGVDGTLAQRMRGTPAERNVRAKTGSFSNARALAGYVSTADGEKLVFSIIANNFGVPADVVERAEDAIAVRLARFSRK